MELESVVSLSKTDILRELITEKLTVAAQHIFAAVERTVAACEEEASGLRQEVERQRRQLEAVVRPEIKVEASDDHLFPVCVPPQVEASQPEPSEDEQQHKPEPSLGFSFEDQWDEENVYENSEPAIPSQELEPLTDPETSSSFSPPSPQSGRKRSYRRRASKLPNHVNFRIRVLEDSEIDVLSHNVFRKYPLHELHCSFGLQEAGFLGLLRSTFPQLAADKPFDIFISDHSKRLLPLKVDTLKPKEIYWTLKTVGSVKSSLYIRLKAQEEPRGREAEISPSQDREGSADSPSRATTTRLLKSSSSGAPPAKRSRNSDPPAHINLKVRLLEDSGIEVLNCAVFQKYPLKEMQFPCGLQEADFLDLLRSTFPQLAGDAPFDLLRADWSKKLQPLNVSSVTPEEIYRTIKSTGAGFSSLYIRLKSPEDLQAKKNHFLKNSGSPSTSSQIRQSSRSLDGSDQSEVEKIRFHKDFQTDAGMSYTDQQMEGREDVKERSEGPAPIPTQDQKPVTDQDQKPVTEQDHETASVLPPLSLLSPSGPSKSQHRIVLKIRVLRNSHINRLSNSVFRKYPLHKLRCPLGLREPDFLVLLRSSFPELAAHQSFDMFITDRSKMLQPLTVKTLTPEEIYRSIHSLGAGKSSLYIRLKGREETQATNIMLNASQRNKAAPSHSIFNQKKLNMGLSSRVQPSAGGKLGHDPQNNLLSTHVDLRIRLLEDSRINFLTWRVFRKYRLKELKFPCGLQEKDFLSRLRSTFPQLADDKPFDFLKTDKRRKLHLLKVTPLTPEKIYRAINSNGTSSLYIRLKAKEEARPNSGNLWQRNGDAAKYFPAGSDEVRLSSSPPVPKKVRLYCKICRVRHWSKKMLIEHAWSHADHPDKLCGVCGGGSASSEELRSHLQSHLEPQSCHLCGKSYLSAKGLNNHVARHKQVETFQCNICLVTFSEKSMLSNHRWAHVVAATHKCTVCDKVFVSEIKLKRHEASHGTPYSCSVCSKAFRSLEMLTQHEENHISRAQVRAKTHMCEVCGKGFCTGVKLKLHLNYHKRMKRHVCTKCNKQFLSKTCLDVHTRVHAEPSETQQAEDNMTEEMEATQDAKLEMKSQEASKSDRKDQHQRQLENLILH